MESGNMAGTLHAFDFLDRTDQSAFPPVCAIFGDEDFLKRLVKQRVRSQVLGNDAEIPFTTFDGDEVTWRDVADEIATMSLFGGKAKRLVIVEKADPFVTACRAKLEDYLDKPHSKSVLVLEVKTWTSSTRLYKALDQQYLQVDCRLPQTSSGKKVDEGRIANWLVHWSKTRYNAKLAPAAAKLLMELEGPLLGLLDQDLAKLSLFVTPQETIKPELVQEVIGGWRARTIWEVVDAAADGNAAEALRQLDLALQSGDPPIAIFGPISWSLRRFTIATRIFTAAERRGKRMSLREALEQAGFRPWPQQALPNAERQIKQLGRERAGKLMHWLLDADLAMKSTHSSPEQSRFVLEQLFLRMARQPAVSGR